MRCYQLSAHTIIIIVSKNLPQFPRKVFVSFLVVNFLSYRHNFFYFLNIEIESSTKNIRKNMFSVDYKNKNEAKYYNFFYNFSNDLLFNRNPQTNIKLYQGKCVFVELPYYGQQYFLLGRHKEHQDNYAFVTRSFKEKH